MKLKNGFSLQKNGWTYISIKGNPRERGYAHGYLIANDFIKIQKMLYFFIYQSYGIKWDYFIEKINEDFYEMTKNDFPELFEEMLGITEGLNANHCKTSIQEIIAWNFYCSISYWFDNTENSRSHEGGAKDRCSAFIAVGDWTEDGKIVCAHNSFCDYIDGQYCYVVLDIQPTNGHRIIMQTSPGWIWSGNDFFITSKGIIGTETTIGGFLHYDKKIPIAYRIRTAMQYGNSMEEYVKILLDGNSGDYANSWLFGDIHKNEIMRLELGLKFHNVEKTTNGVFIGFNATYDPRIRNLECSNQGFFDIRRHQGARHVRLSDLMDQYKGKLNIEAAKQIMADHYDVYLKTENKCSRTVCSHYDLDPREYMSAPGRPVSFAPHGAVDGFVVDSNMAKKMMICGRFGNSCGTPFLKNEYFKNNRQFEMYEPYIFDRPSQPWTDLPFFKTFTKKNNIHKKHKTIKKYK